MLNGSGGVKIAAASATRHNEDLTELRDAIYTPCAVCADGGRREPTWSIRASQVVEDKKRQLVTYHHAVVQVLGVGVLYLPVLWTADPAAERKSGFLTPYATYSQKRGVSYAQSWYQVISPSQDITITPQINTTVNPFLTVDWRRRFYSGSVDVRAGYTYERDFDSHGNKFGSLTKLPFKAFRTQHFVQSDKRMVVTRADPVRRVVHEINGKPAAREFARLVGLQITELTPMIFATHPVVVRIGGQYFVRSIAKVNEDESLTFFCAIDEGIVLTIAKGVDMVENLERAFEQVRADVGPPQLVLGCDCILRRLESEREGIKDKLGRIFVDNNVIGFATYGEQFNSMHVNQTFTGIAIGSDV